MQAVDLLEKWPTEAQWEAHVRKCASEILKTPCVLDVTAQNILFYPQGSYTLVSKDLKTCLPEAAYEALEEALSEFQVPRAFRIRQELVNLKKVCLHMFQQLMAVEKDLKQLSTFYYCDLMQGDFAVTPRPLPPPSGTRQPDEEGQGEDEAEDEQTQLEGEVSAAEEGREEMTLEDNQRVYLQISQAMNGCKGCMTALLDARYYTKAICLVPRHPSLWTPNTIVGDSPSLKIGFCNSEPLVRAQHFIQNHHQIGQEWIRRFLQYQQVATASTPAEHEITSSSEALKCEAKPDTRQLENASLRSDDPSEAVPSPPTEADHSISTFNPGCKSDSDPACEQIQSEVDIASPSKSSFDCHTITTTTSKTGPSLSCSHPFEQSSTCDQEQITSSKSTHSSNEDGTSSSKLMKSSLTNQNSLKPTPSCSSPAAEPTPSQQDPSDKDADSSGGLGSLEQLHTRLRGLHKWPPYVVHYVECVLIAYGACKAVRMRCELQHYSDVLAPAPDLHQSTLSDLHTLAASLRSNQHQDPGNQNVVDESAVNTLAQKAGARRLSMHLDKHLSTLQGCLASIRDVKDLVHTALSVEEHHPRQILAGDSHAGTAAVFVPGGMRLHAGALLAHFRGVVASRQAGMLTGTTRLEQVRTCGGSREQEGGSKAGAKLQKCRKCSRMFTRLWVHRGVCTSCEAEARKRGECPFRCKGIPFCNHAGKCFVCDGWSCRECGLQRGDGEDVRALVLELNPHTVFLDFDRTIATTKHGNSPLVGNHSIDPDLLTVMCTHPRVHIVTRNQNKEDIDHFLSKHGAEVRIHCVEKKCLKSSVMREHMAVSAINVFVDDDIKEHSDDFFIHSRPQIQRVLFVRAGI